MMMSSYIRNIDRDIEPWNGTIKTTIDITEDMSYGGSRFVNQLMEVYAEHRNLDTLNIEHKPLFAFTRDDEKVDFDIKRVIFKEPATIVLWKDGTKTVVKCGKDDVYDEEKGLALCFMKKALNNKGNYNNTFKKYIKENKDGKDNNDKSK